MGDSGIRHTGYGIRLHMIACRHFFSAEIAHLFHTGSFIGAGRITIIYPEKGADFHILARLYQGSYLLRSNNSNFTGAEFLVVCISQIQVGKVFKGYAECILLFPDDNRSATQLVPRGIDAQRRHNQEGHGAVNELLRIPHTVDEIQLLVDDSCYQLGRIDIATAHFQKMCISFVENSIYNLVCIVNSSNRCDGKGTMVGTDNQWLRFII